MAKVKSALLVGVGGQGAILISKIMSNGFMKAGYDVKQSEVHGMAQRGGSVMTFVRYGEKVHSPLIEEAGADVVLAFVLDKGDINQILWEYVKKNMPNLDCLPFIEEDKYWFADAMYYQKRKEVKR